MKKTGLILGILLFLGIVGGTLWYFFLRPKPFYHAEDILPATTIALLQIPDVDQARLKWDQSPLGKIFSEPAVRHFWEKPSAALRQKLNSLPGAGETEPSLIALQKIFTHFHGEAFIGFLGFDLSPTFQLQLVAGFDAKDKASDAQKSIEEMSTELRARFPKGVREEKSHLGVAYQTWSPQTNVIICHARLGNFFLFTTDEIALQTCIEFAKKNRDNPLKKDELFNKTIAKVDAQRDALVYVNPSQVLGKFLPLLSSLPQTSSSGMKDLSAVKAAAASSRFDGSGSVDKVFVMVPEASRPASYKIVAPWERKSLPLVSSKALFYGVTCFDAGKYWDELTASVAGAGSQPQVGKAFEEVTQMLEAQNIHLHPDLFAKLGHEFAIHLDWGEQNPLPQFFVMAETTDGPGLVTTLDRLVTLLSVAVPGTATTPGAAPTGPNMLEVEGKSIHWITLAPQQGIGIYYAHVEPFVVFGFQDSAMTAYINAIAKKQFEGFSTNPSYKSASAAMPKSVNTFMYLDNKPLFEKVYNLILPLAMLGSQFMPSGSAVDFSTLPKTAVISQHLTPSLSYQYFDSEGFYRCSNGPLPPEAPFFLAGVGAGMAIPTYMEAQRRAAAQKPVISPRPPGAAAPGPATNVITKSGPPSDPAAAEAACRKLLAAIDDAKAKWAAQNQAQPGSTVFESQITPFLDPKLLVDGKLVCPLGGQILIGDVGQSATSTALAPSASSPEPPPPTSTPTPAPAPDATAPPAVPKSDVQ